MLLETQALTEEMVKFGMSRLAIGEHLLRIRGVLEPKRKFVSYLRTQCRFSKATAYRYIETYIKVKDNIPDLVLRTAIARGYDIIDLTIVEHLPPPNTQNRTKIIKYLERIEEARKVERSNSATEPDYAVDPDALIREALNAVANRFDRLPTDVRVRRRWIEKLIGMLSELEAQRGRSIALKDVAETSSRAEGRAR